jgi:hypothetical protein
MTIDTIRVVTFRAMVTRSHACYETKGIQLALLELVVVAVSARALVGTRGAEIVDVAELQFLDAVHFLLVVLFYLRVDACAKVVSEDAVLVAGRWWDIDSWCLGFSGEWRSC